MSDVQTVDGGMRAPLRIPKTAEGIWGFPKIRGTFLGVPIIRTIIFWGGLFWGPLFRATTILGGSRFSLCTGFSKCLSGVYASLSNFP